MHIRISSALKLDQKRSPKIGNTAPYQAKMTHLQACHRLLRARVPRDVSVCNNPGPQSLRSLNENQDQVSRQNIRNYYPFLTPFSSVRLGTGTSGRAGGEGENCTDEFCNTLPDRLNSLTLSNLHFTSLTFSSPGKKKKKRKTLKRKRRNMIKNKLKSPTCNKAGTCPRLQKCLRHDTDFTDTLETQYIAFIRKKRERFALFKTGCKYSLCFENIGSTANKIQNAATKQVTLILQKCHYIMSLFTLSLQKIPSVNFFN